MIPSNISSPAGGRTRVAETYIDPYGRVRRRPSRWIPILISGGAWLLLLALYIFYVPSHVSALKLPGPRDVAGAMNSVGWRLLRDSLWTLGRVLLGFTVGSGLGIFIGFCMFSSRTLDALLFSFTECLRPVPPIAWIPFFILWFQLNPLGLLVLVGIGCYMVLVVSTRESLHKVKTEIRRAARSLGATGYSYYVQVLFWAIAPALVAPLRVSLALAFAVTVAGEFMGEPYGIGVLMMVARRTLQTETILLGVIIIAIQSATTDFLLRMLMRRLTRWLI